MKKINTKCIVRIFRLLFIAAAALTVFSLHAYAEEKEGIEVTCQTDPEVIRELHEGLVQEKQLELQQKIGQQTGDSNEVELFSKLLDKLPGRMPSTGDVKALVLPVDFPEIRLTDEEFEKLKDQLVGVHPEPYSLLFYTNLDDRSTAELFKDHSNGKLNWQADIMPLYRLPNSQQYYEENDADLYTLIPELLTYYRGNGYINDFSDYDSDNDGYIDCLILVFAQATEVYFPQGNTWNNVTHTGTEFAVGNETVKCRYFMGASFTVGEYIQSPPTSKVVAHECGHMMGLADNYITGNYNCLLYGTNEMMGGGYQFNAYYRYMLDWIDPVVLPYEEGLKEIELVTYGHPDKGDMEQAVILIPDANVLPFTEFYIAEYRETLYPPKTLNPEGGVILWHVDAEINDYAWQYINKKSYLQPVYKGGGTPKNSSVGEVITFDGEKDLYVTGDVFSSETSPSSDFYDGIYTGAYLEVVSMDSEKAVVKAGFVEPDLTLPPTITFGTPSATHVRDIPKNTDYLYFPVKYENYDTMTVNHLFNHLEVITTGTVTVRNSAYYRTILETGEGEMYVSDLSGDGTVQLRILPGTAKNGAKYESKGALSPIVIVDNTAPVGTVSYSTRDPAAKEVVATLSVNEEIQPTEMTCTFTENGTYTFSFLDLAGNKGTVTATVDWMEYARFSETGNTVSAQLVFARENPPQDADLMVYAAYKEGNKLQYLEALTVSDMQTTFTVPAEYQNCEIELYVWGRDLKPCMAVQTYKMKN